MSIKFQNFKKKKKKWAVLRTAFYRLLVQLTLTLCSRASVSMSEQQRGLVYLITGGCGFLGRHLLRVLLEQEDNLSEVRVFDKRIDSSLNEDSTGETNCGLGFVLFCFVLRK